MSIAHLTLHVPIMSYNYDVLNLPTLLPETFNSKNFFKQLNFYIRTNIEKNPLKANKEEFEK